VRGKLPVGFFDQVESKPKILNIALIAIAVAAIASLLTGADYLEWMLPGGLPFGNALTAIGLSCAAGAALRLSVPDSFLRVLSASSFIGALAWLPVSIGLAGNLTLNFSGTRGQIWIWMTLVTFVLVLGSLIWAILRSRVFRGSNSNSARAA